MYNRQLPTEQMERLRQGMDTHARREPMDATYHLDLNVNGTRYQLQFLMEKNTILPLQAVRMGRDVHNCELITRPTMLGALIEILVEQHSRTK